MSETVETWDATVRTKQSAHLMDGLAKDRCLQTRTRTRTCVQDDSRIRMKVRSPRFGMCLLQPSIHDGSRQNDMAAHGTKPKEHVEENPTNLQFESAFLR